MEKELKQLIEAIKRVTKQFKKEHLNPSIHNKSVACFGKKQLNEVLKILAIIKAKPELLPASFDFAKFETEVKYYFQIKEQMTEVENLKKIITDKYVNVGKDLFCKSMKLRKYVDNDDEIDYSAIAEELLYYFTKKHDAVND